MATMPDFELPEPERADPRDPRAAPRASEDARADAGDAAAERAAASRDEADQLGLRAAWRRACVPLVAFTAGIALAAAVGVAAGVVQDRTARDEVVAVVDRYLAAVESSGDRTDSAAWSAALEERLASNELLQRAIPVAAPPDVVCDEPRVGGDLANVDCRVRVEDRVEATSITLERSGGTWTLMRGLEVPVCIQSGVLRIEDVGGMPIDDEVARGERAVWLLPGRYDVGARTPAQIVVERLDGLVVSASGGAVRWASDTSQQLDADVQATALAFAESCAVAPVDGCPALQARDPAERFEAFSTVGRVQPDDQHAVTYDVGVRRPVPQPQEFVTITVRVDFGEDLDRYDVAVVPPT